MESKYPSFSMVLPFLATDPSIIFVHSLSFLYVKFIGFPHTHACALSVLKLNWVGELIVVEGGKGGAYRWSSGGTESAPPSHSSTSFLLCI